MSHTASQIVDKWMEPKFKFFVNRVPAGTKGRADFLMHKNNMEGEYLGACLDYIRWGGQTTVMYELGTIGLIGFIQHWMELNKGNLIWADKEPSEKFTLPHIKHDQCPRNKEHKGLIKDLAGRVRCSHKSEKKLKPSFITSYKTFDKLSDMDITEYFESEPHSPPCDEYGAFLLSDDEMEKYEREMMEFNNEEPIVIPNTCYAILSDEKMILSLEKVLDKINLEPRMKNVYCSKIGPCKRLDELDEWQKYNSFCSGHLEENDETVHPFCGWTLAWYVQKWYEQASDGKAPVFEKTN